jgi:hypothetical protein
MNDSIQKLFKHLLGSSESGKVLHDKGQKEDQPASDPDGCEYSNVEHRVLISRGKLDALSNKRHVGMCQRMVLSGWVQVVRGGQW